MDMVAGQYIDKRDCFQYVESLFIPKSLRHSRAGWNIVAGWIWPAGHNLPTSDLNGPRPILLVPSAQLESTNYHLWKSLV